VRRSLFHRIHDVRLGRTSGEAECYTGHEYYERDEGYDQNRDRGAQGTEDEIYQTAHGRSPSADFCRRCRIVKVVPKCTIFMLLREKNEDSGPGSLDCEPRRP
jgi:hypothetical protein